MYYLANLRIYQENDTFSTDIVLTYGATVTEAMAAIEKQYGDDFINDVRLIPLGNYESFDNVLLLESGIEPNSNSLLHTIKTRATIDCEE